MTDPNVEKTKFIMIMGLDMQVGNNIYVPDSILSHITIRIMPNVWETEVPGRANNISPIVISLRPRVEYSWKRPETQKGIRPLIKKFLKYGLLTLCQSPCNVPILPVKKPNGQCCFIRDLSAINEAVIPIHPRVPNPYTILTQVPPDAN